MQGTEEASENFIDFLAIEKEIEETGISINELCDKLAGLEETFFELDETGAGYGFLHLGKLLVYIDEEYHQVTRGLLKTLKEINKGDKMK